MQTQRVGFVGLGRMGNPMCQHILRSGFALTVSDLQADAVQALVAEGARSAPTARQVAENSDVVLVMVTDDAQVRQVIAGDNGLLQAAHPGLFIAICSSIHPKTCRDLATLAGERGVGLVDAPVARGIRGAQAGDLAIYVGGTDTAFEACKPVFAAFASRIFHMGPVGAGQITKTCNNLIHWAEVVACHETLTLGARLGIAPADLRTAMLAGSADSRTLRELELIKMTWPDKDMVTAMALAEESNTPVPLIQHVRELVLTISAKDLRALFASDLTSQPTSESAKAEEGN